MGAKHIICVRADFLIQILKKIYFVHCLMDQTVEANGHSLPSESYGKAKRLYQIRRINDRAFKFRKQKPKAFDF